MSKRDIYLNKPPFRRPIGRRAFTLVELVVCIGIISVLMSILLPMVKRVRDGAREVQCQTNLRTLIIAFRAFASDNEGTIPGGYYDIWNPSTDPAKHDWLMGSNSNWQAAPQSGAIYSYVKQPSVYLCPSLQVQAGAGALGMASNGQFDYSMFLSFAGAHLTAIPATCKYTHADGRFENLPTPLLVEENPNHINTFYREGGHGSTDQCAHTHRGGSLYACIDGSVQWFNEDPTGNTYSWTAAAPSGQYLALGLDNGYDGWWNRQ